MESSDDDDDDDGHSDDQSRRPMIADSSDDERGQLKAAFDDSDDDDDDRERLKATINSLGEQDANNGAHERERLNAAMEVGAVAFEDNNDADERERLEATIDSLGEQDAASGAVERERLNAEVEAEAVAVEDNNDADERERLEAMVHSLGEQDAANDAAERERLKDTIDSLGEQDAANGAVERERLNAEVEAEAVAVEDNNDADERKRLEATVHSLGEQDALAAAREAGRLEGAISAAADIGALWANFIDRTEADERQRLNTSIAELEHAEDIQLRNAAASRARATNTFGDIRADFVTRAKAVGISSMEEMVVTNMLDRMDRGNAPVPAQLQTLALHYADVMGFQEYLPLARLLKWPMRKWIKQRRRKTRYLFDIVAHQHQVLDLVAAVLADETNDSVAVAMRGEETTAQAQPLPEDGNASPLEPTYFAVNVSDEGRVISKVEHIHRPPGRGYLTGEAYPASILDQMKMESPGRATPETFEELNAYVQTMLSSGRLATNMMLKGLSIASEPNKPFRVTGMYPSARAGYTLAHQVLEWAADRYFAFFHKDGTPRQCPIFVIGCAVDACGVEAGATAYSMTPHQCEIDDGVVYLGLRRPDFRYLAPYHHELPYIGYNDWDHKGRNDRRGLDNSRRNICWGAKLDPGTGELVFETATFDALLRLKHRIRDGGFISKITNVNKFQDQNSDAANVMLSEKLTGPLRENLDIPNAPTTLLHIEAHRLLQEPIRDPNFGTPLEVHHSVWTGQYLIAYQRQIAKAVIQKFGDELTEDTKLENLTTTDETYRTGEEMACMVSIDLLAMHRHGRAIPWTKKAPLRKKSDTRGAEGTFGDYRMNQMLASNNVNFTFGGASQKAAANFRKEDAKAATIAHGMKWEPPKNKAETWKVVQAAETQAWRECAGKLDAFTYPQLLEFLEGDFDKAKESAQKMLLELAPSGAALIRDTPAWDNPMPPFAWKKELNVTIVSCDEPVRVGVRPVHPSKFRIEKGDLKKIEDTKREEDRALHRLDLAEWASQKSREDSRREQDGAVAQSQSASQTVHAHIASLLLQDDTDFENGGGDEAQNELAPPSPFLDWLELRKSTWNATRTTVTSSASLDMSPSSASASGTVYVMRGEERVEINSALSMTQNEIDVPQHSRRARYIIKKYRAPPPTHDLVRSEYYARPFGGSRGACFFEVARLLILELRPPGKTSTKPDSLCSSDTETKVASWWWHRAKFSPQPSRATRDSYITRLGVSHNLTELHRLELLKLGFVEYGTGTFDIVIIDTPADLILRGPLPPIVASSSIVAVKKGSIILQLNGRSVMDFDSAAGCVAALAEGGVAVGVWSGDAAALLTHDENIAVGVQSAIDDDDDDDPFTFPKLSANCSVASRPTDMTVTIGKRFAYKWDHGWMIDGTAARLHKTGEHRNHLEIVWDDGDQTCLGLSTELKPSLYGTKGRGRWVVLNVPRALEEDGRAHAEKVIAEHARLAYLPKAWATMPPEKLIVVLPMQQLAAIADEGDDYDLFRKRISNGKQQEAKGDTSGPWTTLSNALVIAKESAIWVEENWEEIVVVLGDSGAYQLLNKADEPPGKELHDSSYGLSLLAGPSGKRKRTGNFSAPVTALMISRMLSTEWLTDEDINAVIWRIRASFPNAALASSGLGQYLLSGDIDRALAAVECITPTIGVPVHFPINLHNSHWTLATVDLSAARAMYTDCLQNEPPSKLKASLQALLAKKRAGSGGRAKKPASKSNDATVSVETDHAAMPKQDDTHSCGPLALCGMLLRAAGLPLSMKVRNTSEVCLRLRAIVAAIAAQVLTAEEGVRLLKAL